MINDISGERIANSIMMDDGFPGASFILEGKRDHVFFNKVIDKESAQIVLGHGRSNVIDAIVILNSRGFSRALGMIDRDFDDLLNQAVSIPNLIVTEFHDFEITILESPALEHVLNALASPQKIATVEQDTGKAIKEVFFDLVTPLALLKLANKLNDLNLVFKPASLDANPLTFTDFIDRKTFKYISDKKMVKSVVDFCNNRTKPKSIKDIETSLNDVRKAGNYDLRHLCNGHDITFVIQLALKTKIGSHSPIELSQKRVELDLLLAYDSNDFTSTITYSEIKTWEATSGYKLLRV